MVAPLLPTSFALPKNLPRQQSVDAKPQPLRHDIKQSNSSPSNATIATLHALRPETQLWMRDPRRTPVRVTQLQADLASFTVKVLAFEDKGAHWTFPLWQVDKFLMDPATPQIDSRQIKDLQLASARLNQPLNIPLDAAKRSATEIDLQALTEESRQWLTSQGHSPQSTTPPEDFTAFKDPNALTGWLTHQNALALEQEFATQYVSNPHAGETIKAHRLALADLGLCAYSGRILRDQAELTGDKALLHRKRHILARLAFLRAAFGLAGQTHVGLYRTIYSDDPLTAPRNTGFVSSTFSRAVALRFLKDGEAKPHRALHWQRVPVTRLFMTYLETPQMRAPYAEHEALLLFDAKATPF